MWLCLLALMVAPSGDNALYVSWGDQILAPRPADRLDTPAQINERLPQWCALAQTDTIYWRASAWRIRHGHEVRRQYVAKYWDAVDAAYAAGDPYATAVSTAHRDGRRIYGYLTLFDDGSPTSVRYGDSTPFPWQSQFSIDHPEYLVCDRSGQARQWGVYEYAYPEVRRYMIQRCLALLDQYPFDGIYLCCRTHSKPAEAADQFGFNQPVVDEYRRRYGVDLRTAEFDPATWEALRGEYLTLFLRELHAELAQRGKRLAIGIPLGDSLGPPYGHLQLDWPSWVKDRLIDELVVGIRTGNEHYPSMKGHDRERGYRFSADEGWGLPDWTEEVKNRYGPACREAGVLLRHFGLPSRGNERLKQSLGLDGWLVSAATLANAAGYLTVPDHPALAFADGRLTISVWLKPDGLDNYPRLLSKYDHTAPDNAGRGYEIYLDDGHVVWRLNDGSAEHVLTTEGQVPVGRWTHLVCVSEGAGGRLRVYLDGQPDSVTTPAATQLRVTPVELVIGAYAGGGRPYQGALAELRLYASARTPDRLPDEATDLVARFDFGSTASQLPNLAGDAPAAARVLLPAERRLDGPAGLPGLRFGRPAP